MDGPKTKKEEYSFVVRLGRESLHYQRSYKMLFLFPTLNVVGISKIIATAIGQTIDSKS